MMNNNKKRVTLNRRASSLLLDYQAMIQPTTTAVAAKEESNGTVANEYTRQLVASALSLPSSVEIATLPISTTRTTTTKPKTTIKEQQQQQKDKRIELPLLLKSSLRTPKSASAPCSPTTGLKSVHFNKNNLEEICLFRKVQTPLAISQKNIFWGDENDEEDSDSSSSSSSSSEEEETEPIKSLVYANWPTGLSDIIDKKNKVIRIEKNTIRLMTDLIVGKILVRNLDYHKTVTIRYTFDFWETIDNIGARFHQQQDDHKSNSYDVFSFKIKLPPNATTLYFAVNYKVGTQEYWDNNDGRNYEIQIKSTNISNSKKKKKKSIVKQQQLEDGIINQDHTKEDGLKARYDFSQSIHQAKNNITSVDNNKKHIITTATTTTRPIVINPLKASTIPTTITNTIIPTLSSWPSTSTTTTTTTTTTTASSLAMPIPMRRRSSSSPTGLSCHSPLASSPTFMDLNSQSYMELVNKYCFYSTSPSRSPMSING